MANDTGERLLHAAQESFATRGYDGTSIRSLARAVGITEASVYNHVRSKQDLLNSVVARAEARLEAVAARLEIPFGAPGDAVAFYERVSLSRLEEACDALVTTWLEDHDIVAARQVLALQQYRDPVAGERLRELTVTRPLAFQTELFGALIARGVFLPANPEAVALAFWGPIRAVLEASPADAPDRAETRRLLHLHLTHFVATHVAPAAGSTEPTQTDPRPDASPIVPEEE